MYSTSPKIYLPFRKMALHKFNQYISIPLWTSHDLFQNCKYNIVAPVLITLYISKSVKIQHRTIISFFYFHSNPIKKWVRKGKEKKREKIRRFTSFFIVWSKGIFSWKDSTNIDLLLYLLFICYICKIKSLMQPFHTKNTITSVDEDFWMCQA